MKTEYEEERARECAKVELLAARVGEILAPFGYKRRGGSLPSTLLHEVYENGNRAVVVNMGGGWGPKGKLSFGGCFPKAPGVPSSHGPSTHGLKTPRVNVDPGKSNERITADLKRRFFPEYDKVCAEMDKRNSENSAYHGKLAVNVAKLKAAITDEPATEEEMLNGRFRCYLNGTDARTVYGEITAHADGDVSLDLSGVPMGAALDLLKSLKGAA